MSPCRRPKSSASTPFLFFLRRLQRVLNEPFALCTDPDIKKLDQKEVRHAIRRADRAHIKYSELHLKAPNYTIPPDLKQEIDEGLAVWKSKRTGTQIAAVSVGGPHCYWEKAR